MCLTIRSIIHSFDCFMNPFRAQANVMCVHERTGLELRSKSLDLSGARNDQLTVR